MTGIGNEIDEVHERMTKTIAGSRPPRFTFEWRDDRNALLHYKSHRSLLLIVVGLARAVLKHFNEPGQVSEVSPTTIKIAFARPQKIAVG